MSPTTSLELVVFDCDGVLVDSERLINRIESELIARLGLEWTPNQTRERFKGHTVSEIVAMLEATIHRTVPGEWLYDCGMHIARGFVDGLQPVPGVRDVLNDLAGRGIMVCVGSQAPRARVDLALRITGLGSYFGDRIFTASMAPRSKPQPDLFLYAAARMGSEPTRSAVIEDSPSGVVAAVTAGMRAFGHAADEDEDALRRAGATTFRDMRELPDLLDGGAAAGSRTACAAAARLRAAYEVFAAGDVRSLGTLLADDVTYHLPGMHLGGGTLRGRTAIFQRLATVAASLDEPPVVRVTGVAGHGEWIVTSERFTASRRGRAIDQNVCVTWHVPSTHCTEIWARFEDQDSCNRFWEAS